MIDPALEHSVVVVTGANNPYGIGVGVAKAFAGQGAHVFLHYFRSPAKTSSAPSAVAAPGKAFYDAQQVKTPDDVLGTIRERGGHAHAWEADLSKPASAASLFDEAERVFGPVEILVNNAAHSEHDTFIPSGGRLRNTRAELATGPRPSKLALEAYTRSAAAELGQFGITVNAVSLGPVQTGWIPPALESVLLPTIPLGRIGSPEEVADVIVFLASEQARWVSGQTIFVGGGHGM